MFYLNKIKGTQITITHFSGLKYSQSVKKLSPNYLLYFQVQCKSEWLVLC